MNNFSFLSFSEMKKVSKKMIKYNNDCTNCGSNKSFPYTNSLDSIRYCEQCKTDFKPRIVSVKKYVEEVWS